MSSVKNPGKRIANVFHKECVGCGSCIKVCKRGAITVPYGLYAIVDIEKCTGCGACARECPASVICLAERNAEKGELVC